jgi:hypothetical protein
VVERRVVVVCCDICIGLCVADGVMSYYLLGRSSNLPTRGRRRRIGWLICCMDNTLKSLRRRGLRAAGGSGYC